MTEPTGLPPDAPNWVGIKGEAWGIQQRSETNITVTTFRIERTDPATGERLRPVPVEMRSFDFRGSINEGEKVAVPGRWVVGETMQPAEVWNLTTRSRVTARQVKWRDLLQVFGFLVGLLIGAVVLFGICTLVSR